MDQKLYCFLGGHEQNPIVYICLDLDCRRQRLFCEVCFQSKAHDHHQGNQNAQFKIKDFCKNLDFKYKTITKDQKKLQQLSEKYTNLLELFTISTKLTLAIMKKEIEGLQYHLNRIIQFRDVMNRKLRDEILKSKQFDRAMFYETNTQFFKELDDYYSQQHSQINEFKQHIELKFLANEQELKQINLADISQQCHDFYSQTILDIISKNVNIVQKSIPRGDYFFIQEQQFCFRVFKAIHGITSVFKEGQIINLQEYYQDQSNDGFYKMTDNGKYLIHCTDKGKILIFKFSNQIPYLYKIFILNNIPVSQLLFCEEKYMITQDKINITLFDIESKNFISMQQLFASGEIQYVQSLALLVIPDRKSINFRNIELSENLRFRESQFYLQNAFKMEQNNLFKLSSNLSFLAATSKESQILKVYYTDLRNQIIQGLYNIELNNDSIDLYWNFNDTAVIQISDTRQYQIYYLDVKNQTFKLHSFKPVFKGEIENKSQIHIFGDKMNCIVEVYKDKIVIARSLLY